MVAFEMGIISKYVTHYDTFKAKMSVGFAKTQTRRKSRNLRRVLNILEFVGDTKRINTLHIYRFILEN